MLRFAADENLNNDIVRGLLRRAPILDILRILASALCYRPFERALESLHGARSGGVNTLYVRDAARLVERVRMAPRVKRILLVTSAWHLRRAVALFARAGFAVVPVGADFRSFRACLGVMCWLPSAGALEATGLAVKEWLGYGMQVTEDGG